MTPQLPAIRTYPANHLQSLLDGFCDLSGVKNVELTFKGLSLNSNKVHEEFMFLACASVGNTSQHGIAYAGQAINKGATCIAWEPTQELQDMPQSCVVEGKPDVPVIRVESLLEKAGMIAARFYQHPTRALNVIGITGTNGKTSVAHFIAQIIQHIQATEAEQDKQTGCAIIGTLGNGLYGQLKQTTHTTPDAITLQELMAEYKQQGIKTVAMEVSSHALSQGRVNGIEFNTAVLTNLSRDHLDYHGDMKNYANEKLKLFVKPELEHIVLNKDDAFSQQILSAVNGQAGQTPTQRQIVSYSLHDASADYYATQIKLHKQGLQFTLHSKEKSYVLNSPLIGEFNIHNILAAIAVLEQQSYSLSQIIDAVQYLQTVPGRMESITVNHIADEQPLIVIDFAHTPDALEKALQAVKAHTQGKLYCVFGCGGDRDQGKRPLMAETVEQYADQIMLTSDNPRSEDPLQIMDEVKRGFKQAQSVWTEVDRSRAIEQVLKTLQPRDSVLIAGKGHEAWQEIKGQKIPYSDKACVMNFYQSGAGA